MNAFTNVRYTRLNLDSPMTVSYADGLCSVESSEGNLHLHVQESGDALMLTTRKGASGALSKNLLSVAVEALFGHAPNIRRIHCEESTFADLPARIEREAFFQLSELWLARETRPTLPEVWNREAARPHPVRPVVSQGVVYSRYVPQIGRTLSFRIADPNQDLSTFAAWHHQPRVAKFWELDKPEAELAEYLCKGLSDPHQIPMFLEFDNEPVGYFEMYWVAEDRLGPFCDYGPFDRGFHFLIGNEKFLGFKNTDAVLKSVTHFLFLDEPRTRKLMAEPRADNVNVLKYVETFKAWKKIKEFDFPHKRAALLESKREDFFNGDFL